MQKFYITTAIPYVNASPHIGHALEFVEADALARFYRLAGREVYFLTGADENSLKNVLAAEKEGISTQQLVDKIVKQFIDLLRALEISNDQFIRTTERRHFLGAQKLWLSCKKEDIYKQSYRGLYCVGCEQFYTEKELVNGRCPEHQTELEAVEEENYFFRLSNYQDRLLDLIETNELEVIPDSRRNEVLSFLRGGLEDFSISRSQERARGWGVPVPGDESQVMYVWFDALSNYITALGYGTDEALFKKYWPADGHVIGKGIIRFHAVYWPAMLLSAGLSLPKKIIVHGYLTIDDQKMSKSLGNVIDPQELIVKYGADAVRYFLLREIPFGQDGDFSEDKLKARYEGDLANGLGNLFSRVTTLIAQNLEGKLPDRIESPRKFEEVSELTMGLKFHEALTRIWEEVAWANKYIDETKPWESAKNNPKLFEEVIFNLVAHLQEISKKLAPFMPETAEKIRDALSEEKITKPEALFPRFK